MRRILLPILLVISLPAMAQDEPVVRIDMTPETVSVGEAARMRVTVLVPTWFPRPPEFPNFEIPNAIVRLPANSSRPVSERIGRDTWSGIARNYEVYPLLGARFRIGGQTMRVTYANPGSEPAIADVSVPEVQLRASVPAGAESVDPYIAGRRFELRRDFDRDTGDLKVGDAIVVTYSAELDGLPAIFLPPLAPAIEPALASVYADEPVIEDGTTVRRVERTTLVLNHGGDLVLPAIDLQWWNTESGSVERASIDALSLSIEGPPPVAQAATESAPVDWPRVLILLAVAILLLLVLNRRWPALRDRRRAIRERFRESEEYAYRCLRRALRSGRPDTVYRELVRWSTHLEPEMDAREFAQLHGDGELLQDIESLSGALFAHAGDSIDLKRLGRNLDRARRNYTDTTAYPDRIVLPPLNP